LGFQRLVWCPKCTPASSNCYIEITDMLYLRFFRKYKPIHSRPMAAGRNRSVVPSSAERYTRELSPGPCPALRETPTHSCPPHIRRTKSIRVSTASPAPEPVGVCDKPGSPRRVFARAKCAQRSVSRRLLKYNTRSPRVNQARREVFCVFFAVGIAAGEYHTPVQAGRFYRHSERGEYEKTRAGYYEIFRNEKFRSRRTP
jgi:hypothetical protein